MFKRKFEEVGVLESGVVLSAFVTTIVMSGMCGISIGAKIANYVFDSVYDTTITK